MSEQELIQALGSKENPCIEVDFREDGILWALNRAVFHPRGFALGVSPGDNKLFLYGDGSEAWSYAESMNETENKLFDAFEDMLDKARVENGGE